MSFDINQLEQNDTHTFNLKHPGTDEELKGVTATVYGQDSDQCRKATRNATFKYTEYARKHRGKFMPPAEQEALDLEKLVACTKSIDGAVLNGESVSDVETILTRVPAWREQIGTEIHDRANFIKGSSAK